MSLNDVEPGVGIDEVEAPPPAEASGRRGLSLWFLAIPLAITLAGAALAFFLLGPKDDELLTTADRHAVAAAVANARPAAPAAPDTRATTTTTGPATP
ncbi:MAG TPA: hypothetical protein VF138_12335 [Caulobacteraceae bacterium]